MSDFLTKKCPINEVLLTMNSKNMCKTSNKLVLVVYIHGSEKKCKTSKKASKTLKKAPKVKKKTKTSEKVLIFSFDPGGRQAAHNSAIMIINLNVRLSFYFQIEEKKQS